jgi:hypothetical protein
MQIMCKHKILKLIIKYELLTIYRKEESLVELHNYWAIIIPECLIFNYFKFSDNVVFFLFYSSSFEE